MVHINRTEYICLPVFLLFFHAHTNSLSSSSSSFPSSPFLFLPLSLFLLSLFPLPLSLPPQGAAGYLEAVKATQLEEVIDQQKQEIEFLKDQINQLTSTGLIEEKTETSVGQLTSLPATVSESGPLKRQLIQLQRAMKVSDGGRRGVWREGERGRGGREGEGGGGGGREREREREILMKLREINIIFTDIHFVILHATL